MHCYNWCGIPIKSYLPNEPMCELYLGLKTLKMYKKFGKWMKLEFDKTILFPKKTHDILRVWSNGYQIWKLDMKLR